MNIIYIVKSICVFVILLALLIVSTMCIARCVKRYYNHVLKKSHVIFTVCLVFIAFISVVLFGDYVYPFERKLNPVLYAEFEVPEEYALPGPGAKFWRGAYEAYGGFPASMYFDPDEDMSMYGIAWPLMDFEHFSFIITYGQKIDTLSYNVWDEIDEPFSTVTKAGHITFKEEFSPRMVYIYQIPKLRIDNDFREFNKSED